MNPNSHSSSSPTQTSPPQVMDVIQHENVGRQFIIERMSIPEVDEDQVLIMIAATSVTGLDLYRRWYSFDGLNQLLGMECSGTIAQVGSNVTRFKVGDKVCALLMGGGYAEFVAVDSRRVLPIPVGISVVAAASLPYDASFVWYSLFMKGNLQKNCTILIRGGCGEYVPLAITLAKDKNCTIFTTTRRREETKYYKALGADYCLEYRHSNHENLVHYVAENTNGKGVDFIFDPTGNGVSHNIEMLAKQGTLVYSGGYSSHTDDWDFKAIAFKQVKVIGVSCTILKPAAIDEIIEAMTYDLWPKLSRLKVGDGIYRIYKFKDVWKAHDALLHDSNKGKKILLRQTLNQLNQFQKNYF